MAENGFLFEKVVGLRLQQNGFARLHRLTHWLFLCGHFALPLFKEAP